MLIELNLLKIWKAIMLVTSTPHNPELRIINSEGDFVCVHRSVPLWFEVCFASRFLRRDDTHEPCVSRNIQPIPACFSQ